MKLWRWNSSLTLSLILITIIGLTGLIAYANIVDAFFLSDDFVLIALFSKLGPFGLWVNQQHGQSLFFRPVLSLISFIDYKIWGLNPVGYHLTNLIFHGLNALGVGIIGFYFTQYLTLKKLHHRLFPYLAGAIFLLLPSHTEAVSWISARTDVISSFFGIFSFICYLAYRQSKISGYWIAALGLFLCSLLSKESVVTYPGLIILWEIYDDWAEKSKSHLQTRLKRCFSFIGVLAIYFIFRYVKIGTLVGGYGENVHLSFKITQILQNIIIYPTRSLLPPRWDAGFLFWLFVFIGLGILFFATRLKSRLQVPRNLEVSKLLIFLILAFYTIVLPALNVSVSIYDTQGERYLYFASVFSTLYLSVCIILILSKLKTILLFSGILVLSLGFSLNAVNQNWSIAGDISQGILEDMRSMSNLESVLITALPDNFRGAYIYRTGLIQGLYLWGDGEKFKIQFKRQKTNPNFEQVKFDTDQIKIVMSHNLLLETDTIKVEQTSPNLYRFVLSNPETYFWLGKKHPLRTEEYEITSLNLNDYELKLKNPSLSNHLLFYSAGHLVKKNPQS